LNTKDLGEFKKRKMNKGKKGKGNPKKKKKSIKYSPKIKKSTTKRKGFYKLLYSLTVLKDF